MNTYGSNYLQNAHTRKGLGKWRSLYLEILSLYPKDVDCIELGAGEPNFILQGNFKRKVAVDYSELYKAEFDNYGIEFYVRNLDKEDLDGIGKFQVAVCSDVFEHLLDPAFCLKSIKKCLTDEGILFSHVPNEFSLKKTLKIMFSKESSMYFHKDIEEWHDPHIRRFSDLGFNKMLALEFKYNIKITQLRWSKLANFLNTIKIKVPYCLEGGPTYISTNSPEIAEKFQIYVNSLR